MKPTAAAAAAAVLLYTILYTGSGKSEAKTLEGQVMDTNFNPPSPREGGGGMGWYPRLGGGGGNSKSSF